MPAPWIATAVGAVCGLAWAAALRAFMWEVAGDDAGVEWAGTFVWVLLPGAVIGALLAWAEHRRWTGSLPHARWLIWSPMLFAAVLFQNPLDLLDGFEGGIGLAAVAVPAMCMLGGYAIAGHGPLWVRGLCGLITLSAIPIWSLTATDVGGAVDVARRPPRPLGRDPLLGPARDVLHGRSDTSPHTGATARTPFPDRPARTDGRDATT